LPCLILTHDTRPDLYLIVQLEYTSKYRAASNTALEFLNFSTRFVDVETSDNDHVWLRLEIAHWDRNLRNEVLIDGIDCVCIRRMLLSV